MLQRIPNKHAVLITVSDHKRVYVPTLVLISPVNNFPVISFTCCTIEKNQISYLHTNSSSAHLEMGLVSKGQGNGMSACYNIFLTVFNALLDQ